MPRPKATPVELKQRVVRATEWKLFRKDFLFTQRRLADIVGISRRTVQQIEAGNVTPNPGTRRLFAVLQEKHQNGKKQPEKRRTRAG